MLPTMRSMPCTVPLDGLWRVSHAVMVSSWAAARMDGPVGGSCEGEPGPARSGAVTDEGETDGFHGQAQEPVPDDQGPRRGAGWPGDGRPGPGGAGRRRPRRGWYQAGRRAG